MKKLKTVLKFLLKTTTLLVIALFIYGTINQHQYNRKVEQSDKSNKLFSQLDNHKIHYNLIGDGKYTFILQSGLGTDIKTWDKIKDSLAKIGRVFMYERSGLGFSEETKQLKTTEQITAELNKVIQNENIKGPYILIGHSFGGVFARYYAHRYPEEIAGIFLIDPSHEKMTYYFESYSLYFKLNGFIKSNLAWSGLPQFILPNRSSSDYKTSKNIRNNAREKLAIQATMQQMKDADIDLTTIPMHIISTSTKGTVNDKKDAAIMKAIIARSKSNISKHVSYNKPHNIHITNPEIVLNEFYEFFDKINLEASSHTIN